MKYRAVHFDMDGVLANTEPLHVAAEQQTCRDFDFDIDPNQWGGFKGMTADDIFTHLLNTYGDSQTLTVERLIDHKTNLFIEMSWDNLEPIDGAIEFVKWARHNVDKMSLVTSSNRRVQSHIMGAFGIGKYFDKVITGDDIPKGMGKPNPEPYLRALQKTGASANRSLVVEDSKAGIRAGLGAKCAVLAVTTSHSKEELREVAPTYIVDDFMQARDLLKK